MALRTAVVVWEAEDMVKVLPGDTQVSHAQ